ncbi:MAG TPA: hypothetical protein VGW40_13300 [Allosphingosinicella sp.]|nr:hypothetical protein [Allosphingosinicella sp.]
MRTALLLVALLAASPALAQQQAAPQLQRLAPPRSPALDANLRDPGVTICRRQATIGSRLTRQRICATRQQWLDQSRGDRELAEQAQTRRTWCGGGACPP